MSTLPIGMIIESLVAILLMITIGYCWTLNRRLQRLRADEETLRATISELMTATEIAERAILGLKATAATADKTLGSRLKDAQSMSERLAGQLGEGEKIFSRITQIAEAARAASAHREAIQRADDYAAQREEEVGVRPGYAYASSMPAHAPAEDRAARPAPAEPVRSRTADIRSAAAEATARLEQFRRRSEGAAA